LANDGTTRKELVGKFYHLFDSNVCKWIGRVSEADNIANLIQSDLYVSTSKSDGSSISLLEAMAIGTPVLITDNSPNREWIIDGKSGYLFSGDSGLELAEKIHITMSSASRPKSLLSTARNTVERRADWHIIEEIITHAIIILIEKQKQ
jgi:glycosyltransferase involved in cell wall biosynthesis